MFEGFTNEGIVIKLVKSPTKASQQMGLGEAINVVGGRSDDILFSEVPLIEDLDSCHTVNGIESRKKMLLLQIDLYDLSISVLSSFMSPSLGGLTLTPVIVSMSKCEEIDHHLRTTGK
jgi:hypothetical protein